ncbi:MAG: type II secretion system protein GspJ, partial [Rhodanobacter sp.]
MNAGRSRASHGFTLIELLAALLVLSLLALMAYRGLGVVMASRDRIQAESAQWRHLASFFTRFERDVQLAAPRGVRGPSAGSPAWLGRPDAVQAPLLEFTRFAGAGDADAPYRVGYGINGARQIEWWVWPVLDRTADTLPTRYAVLDGVKRFRLQYLGPAHGWSGAW